MTHGFALIFYEPRHFDTTVHSALARLCQFPVHGIKTDLLNNDLKIMGTLPNFYPVNRVTVLVTTLQSLVNQRILSRAEGITVMLKICQRLVSEWKVSEQKREKDEAEKESLYLTK